MGCGWKVVAVGLTVVVVNAGETAVALPQVLNGTRAVTGGLAFL